MNEKDGTNLLKIIDDRVKKILNDSKYSKIYTATVTQTDLNLTGDIMWVKARILGEDTEFTFPNHTGKPLSGGDKVYIQTIGGDLNTGIITQKITNYQEAEVEAVFPIGAIYMTLDDRNPSEYFGGYWERIAAGRFLISADIQSTTSTYIVGQTGGEAEHILTVDEMPTHNHVGYGYALVTDNTGNYAVLGAQDGGGTAKHTRDTGGGEPHNNIPPYLAVYMWQRKR